MASRFARARKPRVSSISLPRGGRKRILPPVKHCAPLLLVTVVASAFVGVDRPATAAATTTTADPAPASQPFLQETAETVPTPDGVAPSGFTVLDLAPDGTLRALDGKTFYVLKEKRLLPERTAPEGVDAGSSSVVRQVVRSGDDLWLATDDGLVRLTGNEPTEVELAGRHVHQVTMANNGLMLAATDRGLWLRTAAGEWERAPVIDSTGRDWAAGEVTGVAITPAGDWWIAFPAGVARKSAEGWTFFTGREGLPVAGFTCAAAGPHGEVWFGTRQGAVRFENGEWSYREGPRWLPGNEVRSIVVDAERTAWFATDGGLGCIRRQPMTLAAKAVHYEQQVERFIKRTPFGYLSEVRLGAAGDRPEIIYSDSDNDGLWTAMYGGGECFAYAATGQPEFKARARQAFEALRFLQTVTQGGPHSPPKGFVARTIRPVSWPDPNEGRLEQDRESQKDDRLWKVYEPRWPLSADGQWYWKSDTSSDELDGHYFFYAAYYDHVAETEAERDRVREVVRDLTDHLVDHEFCLVDHDGTPTRWARFGPQFVNDDPLWWVERGLNSLSILSYLAVAEHITGDTRYGRAADELINEHGYGANVMNPKVQMGIGSGNQSDDEMAFMCFYDLIRYTRNDTWRNNWRFAFHAYWALVQPELNPFFNYAFAGAAGNATYTNAYGTVSLAPWPSWREDSLATLRGFPLERVNWPLHNSHRLDLQILLPQQSRDLADTDRNPRGYRVNGKVLPVEERHFNHWNTDPWQLDYGGDGRTLASGTVFLLPYYMGMYHGFIGKP